MCSVSPVQLILGAFTSVMIWISFHKSFKVYLCQAWIGEKNQSPKIKDKKAGGLHKALKICC